MTHADSQQNLVNNLGSYFHKGFGLCSSHVSFPRHQGAILKWKLFHRVVQVSIVVPHFSNAILALMPRPPDASRLRTSCEFLARSRRDLPAEISAETAQRKAGRHILSP